MSEHYSGTGDAGVVVEGAQVPAMPEDKTYQRVFEERSPLGPNFTFEYKGPGGKRKYTQGDRSPEPPIGGQNG